MFPAVACYAASRSVRFVRLEGSALTLPMAKVATSFGAPDKGQELVDVTALSALLSDDDTGAGPTVSASMIISVVCRLNSVTLQCSRAKAIISTRAS